MAVTPGPVIQRVTARSSSAATPTAADTLFLIGLTDRGSTTTPERITGMADYATQLGLRTGANGDDNSIVYDALDAYFALGGQVAYVQRYVGPSAVVASTTIQDGSAATVGTIRAASAGAWGNTLTFTIQTNSEDSTIPSGSFVIIVYVSGTEVERSPVLADKTALLAWAPATPGTGTSQYVAITSGASANDPAAVSARALSSGAGDRASATTTEFAAALALLTADLGPGQVTFPGATATASHALVQSHAATHNRVALLDGTDTATTSTLTSTAATDRAATGAEFSAIFWPWVVIPGLTAGTTRTVSPSVVAAALMARNDNSGNTPNAPAAGDKGEIGDYAIDLSQAAVSDATRGTLNEAGVAVFREMLNGIRLYGYRTLADPLTNPDWIGLNNSRMFCYLSALCSLVAEAHEFREITPEELAKLQGDLLGVLQQFYPGTLYGDTFSEAARVDMSINDAAYAASLREGATVSVRLAEFAERVVLNLRKAPITEVLA